MYNKTTIQHLAEIKSILKQFVFFHNNIGGWIPKDRVRDFFKYEDNQLRKLDKKLVKSKIGKRIFYRVENISELLNNNIIK